MPNGIITSPNMGLQIPSTGVTTGPEWMQAIVQSLNIIDAHNHSPGEGVLIGANGLGLTSDLSLSGFGLTAVSAVTFTPKVSTVLDTIYVNGVDLFYLDGNNNVVQITSGGVVNATASGISSGTATASFVGSVLVVNAAANTPANIQGASILIGNNIASSKYVTLSPPNALAANYQLFLPAALPGSTLFLSLDSSGNIATQTNAALATALPSHSVAYSQLVPIGSQSSSSSGFFTYSGGITFTTALTTTFTGTGRPVMVALQADGSTSTTNAAVIGNSIGANNAFMRFTQAGSTKAIYPIPAAAAANYFIILPGSTAPVTYTFDVNAPSGTTSLNKSVLTVQEL